MIRVQGPFQDIFDQLHWTAQGQAPGIQNCKGSAMSGVLRTTSRNTQGVGGEGREEMLEVWPIPQLKEKAWGCGAGCGMLWTTLAGNKWLRCSFPLSLLRKWSL